jgi:hypothetical protein
MRKAIVDVLLQLKMLNLKGLSEANKKVACSSVFRIPLQALLR